MRTTAGGAGGVCDNCAPSEKRWVAVDGFVSARVVRLEVHLQDGAVREVPVETWPNDDGVGAFIFFPPSAHLVGDVLAYDIDGGLLARAPLCGLAEGSAGCDVGPTEQIAPAGVTMSNDSKGFSVTYPTDWSPASEIITPTLSDPREMFALGTYPLRPGGPNCAQYPVNALEDLGPTDALIWLAERQQVSGSALARPADFETWMTTVQADDSPACLSTPKDFVHHYGSFTDAGREFDLYVAYGTAASPTTLTELWAILNGMRFLGPVQSLSSAVLVAGVSRDPGGRTRRPRAWARPSARRR
jgi:hypothetical protein